MPRDMSSLKELSAWDISKYQTAKKCYHILFVWVNIWISNQDKPKTKRHYNGICDAMSTWSNITFLPVWTHYWQYTIQPPFISYFLWSLISSLFWFCHFFVAFFVAIQRCISNRKMVPGGSNIQYPFHILYPLPALQFMFLRDPSPVLVYPCQQYTNIFNSAFDITFVLILEYRVLYHFW